MKSDEISTASNSISAKNNVLQTDMLLELICKGDETGFKTLLQSRIDVDTERLLNAVTKRSNEDVVELLADAGANVNHRREYEQWTPLHIAAKYGGCIGVVQSLIKKGGDPDARDPYDGTTPLHVAIENTQKDIAQLLIRSGADINLCDDENWAPLHYASWYGCPEVVQSLIKKGADLNARNSSGGNTPLHAAIANRHKEIAKVLINSGADINLCGDENWTALHYASWYKCTVVVHSLIKKGADLNARTSSGGNTPLHAAIANGHKNIAKLLISSGADINLCDDENWAPLHYALWYGCPEVVQSLIKKGADLDTRTSGGNTPLHAAIANRHKDVIELLIRSGADINLCDDENWTPLHYASWYGCPEVVQSLIKIGADLNARNSSGGNTPLHAAIANGHKDIVDLLISVGVDINLCDDKNWTPLRYTLWYGCPEVIQSLIKKGADLFSRNSSVCNTPLHAAIANKHKDIDELLISSETDINLCDDENWTPLHYA